MQRCSELSLRRFKVQLCLGFRLPKPGSQTLVKAWRCIIGNSYVLQELG